MRILFVAFADSIHTARWINQLHGQGWDIHLFPVFTGWKQEVHPELREVTVHGFFLPRPAGLDRSVRFAGPWKVPFGHKQMKALVESAGRRRVNESWRLASLIRGLRPDVVHSLEFQHAAYLTCGVREHFRGEFPLWCVSNWGSDIYLFGRFPDDAAQIRAVLAQCDWYCCECERDVGLARDFGYGGPVFPVVPNTGGLPMGVVRRLRQPGPVSSRRLIVLKGYQHWAGRALCGLRALELIAADLKGYTVAVYSAPSDVVMKAMLFSRMTGVPVEIVCKRSHADMLGLHGRARVSISLSISDALSTSFLEALAMGSYPIQSDTSGAGEWLRDGAMGTLVPAEDPHIIAEAIRRAIHDDALVDAAAAANARVADARLDEEMIRPQVIAAYKKMRTGERVGVKAEG